MQPPVAQLRGPHLSVLGHKEDAVSPSLTSPWKSHGVTSVHLVIRHKVPLPMGGTSRSHCSGETLCGHPPRIQCVATVTWEARPRAPQCDNLSSRVGTVTWHAWVGRVLRDRERDGGGRGGRGERRRGEGWEEAQRFEAGGASGATGGEGLPLGQGCVINLTHQSFLRSD